MFHPHLPTLIDDHHWIESTGDNRFVVKRGEEEIIDLEIRNMIVTGTARMPVVSNEGTDCRSAPPASTSIGPMRLELGAAFRVDGKEFVILPPMNEGMLFEGILAYCGLWLGYGLLLVAVAVFVFFSWSYLHAGGDIDASDKIVHLVKSWSRA